MILSDLESLSKIFNDTNRRAVSLRQLCFLFLPGPPWPAHRDNVLFSYLSA